MSDIRVVPFEHLENPIEDFLALPKRLENLDDDQARAERAGTQAVLDASNSYYRNGSSRSFVAYLGETPSGRITAFHNKLLSTDTGRFGLVGHFSCKNDVDVARALTDAAADWFKSRELNMIRGPMAGDLWHRWRFMTRGFETAPFPGEPRQPEYYPELFTGCGFAPVRTYCTKLITDLEGQLERFSVAVRLNQKRGYTFRNFDPERWSEDIKALHELCQHSFASYWSVTPIAHTEFADIYNRWLRRVGPDHIVLALDSAKDVVGLGLAIAAPADTLNIRTLAVLPGQHGYGLGQAIAAELYRRAIAKGQKKIHHCQMGPDAPPQRWDRGRGRVTREYAMYERSVD